MKSSVDDRREDSDLGRSMLDASWIVEADGIYYPVCSFGDPRAAMVVLFLEVVEIEDPISLGSSFWSPWIHRSLEIGKIFVGDGDSSVFRERAVVWRVVDGLLEPGCFVTPEAKPLISSNQDREIFQEMCGVVQGTIEQILATEISALYEAHLRWKAASEEYHRLARVSRRHRPTKRTRETRRP